MRKLAFCIYENKDADQLRGNKVAQLICLCYWFSHDAAHIVVYHNDPKCLDDRTISADSDQTASRALFQGLNSLQYCLYLIEALLLG